MGGMVYGIMQTVLLKLVISYIYPCPIFSGIGWSWHDQNNDSDSPSLGMLQHQSNYKSFMEMWRNCCTRKIIKNEHPFS